MPVGEEVKNCDNFMKLRESSSGCKTRPAKGEPARPVASLATAPATVSAKRRYASVWAMDVGHETTFIPSAERLMHLEGSSGVSEPGRGGVALGGVFGHGTRERRRPGNPGDPHSSSVEHGFTETPDPNLQRAAGWWVHLRPNKKSTRAEVGQRQGKTVVEADAFEGVGGLRTSDDIGEREGTRTRQSKGGPC